MNYSKTRIACYTDYIVQAIINNFLPLLFVMFNTDYGVTYAQLGFLTLLNFSVQLGVDIASIKLAAKIGTRYSVVLANLLCGSGLVLLGILPRLIPNAFLGICIAVLFSAAGGGLIEVFVSPIMDRISGDMGKKFMSFLHSFYCWGQILVVLVTTAAILFFGKECWSFAAVCWSVIPFVCAVAFLRVPIVEDEPPEQRMNIGQLFRSGPFILFIILMFSAGASELAMSQWASTFAEQGLGLSKFTGDLLGPCAFAFCMGVGRIINSILPDRIGIKSVLIVCSIIAAASYLVASLCDNSIIAVLACALCGLGVSAMWPGVLSMSSAKFPHGGNAMFSLLAMAGDLGCSVGPWIAGIIAGIKDLNTALLCCTVFPLVSLAVLSLNKNKT